MEITNVATEERFVRFIWIWQRRCRWETSIVGFFMQLIISLEFCIFFKFILLIGNSYDHPWHADVLVVNQYLMTNKQTLRRRETVVEHDSTVLTHKHKAERKFPHFFTKDGLRPSEDSLRSIRGILSNIDIKWRILM